MPDVQPLKSSGDLRAELMELDLDYAALDGKLSSVNTRVRYYALSGRRGDADAVRSVVDSEAARRSIQSEMLHTAAARAALLGEFDVALEREAAEQRAQVAAEARKFGEAIGPVGAELDRLLSEFKNSYIDLKRRLHQGEMAGYGPSGSVSASALTPALRASLWRITELAIEAPHTGLGRSFASLTRSWSGAAEGAAKRLLAPPSSPPSRPNGANGAKPLPSGGKMPRQADLTAQLDGDDSGFTVYADRGEADAGLAAASRGPK
jgi:hypothetical protein